jgi:hypothetical protein
VIFVIPVPDVKPDDDEDEEEAEPAAASFGDVYFRLHERPFANVSA